MEYFETSFKDDDGTIYEVAYWVTKGRCFAKYRRTLPSGVVLEGKGRRISEEAYISAYESYKNY